MVDRRKIGDIGHGRRTTGEGWCIFFDCNSIMINFVRWCLNKVMINIKKNNWRSETCREATLSAPHGKGQPFGKEGRVGWSPPTSHPPQVSAVRGAESNTLRCT